MNWKIPIIAIKVVKTVRETLGSDAMVVTAPTGDAAAVNINGNTIHFKFKNLYNLNMHNDLTSKTLHFMYYKNLKFIIMDKMSLVGVKLLRFIDKRCRDMFPHVDESFGVLHVYLFCDFPQFLAVKDASLYNNIFTDPMCSQGALISKLLNWISLSVIGQVWTSNFQKFLTA